MGAEDEFGRDERTPTERKQTGEFILKPLEPEDKNGARGFRKWWEAYIVGEGDIE